MGGAFYVRHEGVLIVKAHLRQSRVGVLRSAQGSFESKHPLEAEFGGVFYVRHKGVFEIKRSLEAELGGAFKTQ